ncbi:MAG TPA: hypothetical protein V6C89_02955 [Drouetiella sp.]|jgi:tetratricopeptide (TPR) repeat protein
MNTKDNGTKNSKALNGNTGSKSGGSITSPRFTVRHRAGKTPLMMHEMTECTGEGDCIHEQGVHQVEPVMASQVKSSASARKVSVKSNVAVKKVGTAKNIKPKTQASKSHVVESVSSAESTNVNSVTLTKKSINQGVAEHAGLNAVSATPFNATEFANSNDNETERAAMSTKFDRQLQSVKNFVENKRKILGGGLIATLAVGVIAGSTVGIGKMLPANTNIATFVTGKLTDFHADQLSKQGKISDAILEYEKAIQQSPGDLTAYKNLAGLYETDTYEWAKAVKVLKDAAMVSDADADVYQMLAYAQFWTGANDDAAKSAQKSIDLRRDDAIATSTMALIVGAGGDLPKGKDLIQQSLNADNNNPRVIANAALFYRLYAKDYSKAEELIRRAINIAPDDANNYWELSNIMRRENKMDEVEAALRKAQSLQPENGSRAVDLADYLSSADAKKYSEGADMYRKAVSLGYDDVATIGALAAALYNDGKYADAAVQYQKAADLDPNNSDWELMIGRSQLQVKNYSAAKDAFTKLLGMDASASTYNWLGCANYGLGDYNTAISNFITSTKLNNTDATVYANLANADDKVGNMDAAANCAIDALIVDANSEQAWTAIDLIGNHMISNNQQAQAIQLFKTALSYSSNANGRAQVVTDLSRIS